MSSHQTSPVPPDKATHERLTRYSGHFPLMERPHWAFLLAVLAGSLNAWTFATTQTFGTAQTGNVVMVGYRLAQGDWPRLIHVTGAIITFGLGVMLAAALVLVWTNRRERYFPPLYLLIITVLVAAFILARGHFIADEYITWVIAFAGGLQANGAHLVDGEAYSNVGMTQGTANSFAYLALALMGRTALNGVDYKRLSGLHFLALLGFAGGGAAGFFVDTVRDGYSLVFAVVLSAIVALAALFSRTDPDPVLLPDGAKTQTM